ncbi:MAG TPA: four helix bundle protein [Candidatus Acidoferrales bacterium]|jgi:four helix bundle protein|nr:four helix bundle protein [Candidatus Acidoferrales bacterium]
MDAKNTANYRESAPAAAARENYRTFEDLDVYKAAREFRKEMYSVARRLPKFENFGLCNQIRRAAVSLTNNIAEGHGRYHYLEQIKFCLNSRGSLEELLDDLNVCEDESYLPNDQISRLKQEGWRVQKLLNGYMRWLRAKRQGASLELRETSHDDFTDDELNEMVELVQTVSTFQPFNVSTK